MIEGKEFEKNYPSFTSFLHRNHTSFYLGRVNEERNGEERKDVAESQM